MAKNWKVAEAIKAVQTGNKEDIIDIGRRFPLFLAASVNVNEAALTILEALPDYCTARKIESTLKGEVQDDEDAGDTADASDEDQKPEKTDKKSEKTEKDLYEGKTAKELYDMCKKKGIEVETKQKPEVYIKALKAATAKDEKEAKAKAAAKTKEKPEDDWGDDDAKDTKAADTKKKKEKPAEDAGDDWDL